MNKIVSGITAGAILGLLVSIHAHVTFIEKAIAGNDCAAEQVSRSASVATPPREELLIVVGRLAKNATGERALLARDRLGQTRPVPYGEGSAIDRGLQPKVVVQKTLADGTSSYRFLD